MNHKTGNNQNTPDRASPDRMILQASEVPEAAVPDRILIAPWGEVTSSSGAFVLDEQAAQATIARFEAHGADLPIDIEHQTLGGSYASPSGQAPAMGWIQSLSVVSASDAADAGNSQKPGLWADVEWTEQGRELIAKRAYRYLSPVVLVRRDDRRIAAIHSVALTNKPAIVGMTPVVNTAENGDKPDDAASEGLTHLCNVLVMNTSEPLDVVLLAAADRIRTLEREAARKGAVELVEHAMSEGKLTAAQRAWAIELAERDPDEFRRWSNVAPPVVPLGRVLPQDGADTLALTDRATMAAAARAEYRRNRDFLGKICTEEAYVADAVRDRNAGSPEP